MLCRPPESTRPATPFPYTTLFRSRLDLPGAMAEAAAALADAPLVKIKVDRSDPEAQIRAVRAAAPRPRVIVDPNESWTIAEVERLQPLLAELRIDQIGRASCRERVCQYV